MRQAAEAAVRPDEERAARLSTPRRGSTGSLIVRVDAMRDLPLRKMPEEVILALATTRNPVKSTSQQ